MAHHHSYVSDAIRVSPAGSVELAACWSRIVVAPEVKERMVNHALLSIELRRRGVATVGLPLHGLIVLSGPPGVGKTTLARGLGSELSSLLGGAYGEVRVVEVNLHVLPSELLGRTQRNIVQLFEEELPRLAETGPIVVVLDEVEVLAVSRSQLSFDINPADVFRGTAALLSALDWIARELPGAFVVGTTNLPDALDEAVRSRADLVLELAMPTVGVIRDILEDTLDELANFYPGCRELAQSARLEEVAALLEGADGRQVRKFVADALAARRETALDPSRLSIETMVELAKARVASPA